MFRCDSSSSGLIGCPRDSCVAVDGSRTHTVTVLNGVPLPIGVRQHDAVLSEGVEPTLFLVRSQVVYPLTDESMLAGHSERLSNACELDHLSYISTVPPFCP